MRLYAPGGASVGPLGGVGGAPWAWPRCRRRRRPAGPETVMSITRLQFSLPVGSIRAVYHQLCHLR